MRILLVCLADMSSISGSQIRARLIAEGLSQLGEDVAVMSPGFPKDFEPSSIDTFPLKPGQGLKKRLVEVVESFRPDILFGITEAGLDVLADVRRKFKLPLAVDIHALGVVEILELGRGYGRRLPRILNSLKWLSQTPKADVVLVSNPTIYRLARLFNKNVLLVGGMTNVDLFSKDGPHRTLGQDPSKLQVLYAGNFHKWQGIDLLCDAIGLLGDLGDRFEFTFVGPASSNRQLIDDLSTSCPGACLRFVSQVDYFESPAYYRGADVLVIPRPSMWSTRLAMPQKLGDYLASGRAIVATDLTPHRWALSSPHCGILCEPSAQGLADGLLSTLDSELRRRLGREARSKAEKDFAHIEKCKMIKELFIAVLGRRGRR